MKPSQISDVSNVPVCCCSLRILLSGNVCIAFDIVKLQEQFKHVLVERFNILLCEGVTRHKSKPASAFAYLCFMLEFDMFKSHLAAPSFFIGHVSLATNNRLARPLSEILKSQLYVDPMMILATGKKR